MARRLTLALFLPLGLIPAWATAQLADPTRPPLQAAVMSGGVVASPAAASLQSVILRKEGRPAALINGEVVELGGMVGEARLVKVEEDAVVLLGPEGRETLRLIPAAEKKAKVGAGGTAKSIGLNAVKGETRK